MIHLHKNQYVLKAILGALVIAALILGYKIFDTRKGEDMPAVTKEASVADRALILRTPTATSTEGEKIAYAELIRSNAVVTDTLNVSGCAPDPVAISVRKGSTIKIKNDDDVVRVISFGAPNIWSVEPLSSRSIVMDFKDAGGLYAYGCNGSAGPAGIMLVW